MSQTTIDEIVENFYLEVINSQLIEFKLAESETTSEATKQVEAARRRLGRALSRLLTAFIPEERRTPRLFRAKYTDELNLELLDDWLISAANRVFDLAHGENSLLAVKPLATDFLDVLARVQTAVSTSVDESFSYDTQTCSTSTVKPVDQQVSTNSPSFSFFRHESFNSQSDAINTNPKQVVSESRDQDVVTDSFTSEHSHNVAADSLVYPSTRITISNPVLQSPFLFPIESIPDAPTRVSNNSQPTSSGYHRITSCSDKASLPIKFRLPRTFPSLLMELDGSMATFEFALVNAVSRRLRTVAEVGEVHDVAVLFSETIMWALAVGLIESSKLSDRDPILLVSLPRLAVFVGCYVLPYGPIGYHHLNTGCRPPFMFADSVKELSYLGRQLSVLRSDQLWRLACWLSPHGLSDAESRAVTTEISRSMPKRSSKLDLNPLRRLVANDLTCTPTQEQLIHHRKRGRFITWSTSGLHSIYKCISNVAGMFTNNFPTEYRDIIQMAIEINDPGDNTSLDQKLSTLEVTDGDLVPLAPITHINFGKEPDPNKVLLENDLENRIGFIKGVNLKHIFDWNRVLFGPEPPPCKLLFESRLLDTKDDNLLPPLRQQSFVKWASIDSETSISDLFAKSVDEIGVDIAASIDNVNPNDTDPSKQQTPIKCSGRRPFKWSMIIPSTIEGVPSFVQESVYPLPRWQPDNPTFHDSVSRPVETIIPPDQNSTDDDEDDDPEHTINKPLNRWDTPPRSSKECVGCKSSFNLFRRRHHCRRCGHIFCGSCCSYWAPVESLRSLQPVRVCRECAEFVQHSLTDLIDGDCWLICP